MKNWKVLAALAACLVVCVCCLFVCKKDCEHEWSAYRVMKRATCTEDGLLERVCEHCGEKESKVDEATGHDYGSDGVCDGCGDINEEIANNNNNNNNNQGGGNTNPDDDDNDDEHWTGNY
jgi:hypothetical protein